MQFIHEEKGLTLGGDSIHTVVGAKRKLKPEFSYFSGVKE